ncbi:hypothetical protein ACHAXS_002155 [Conticribra weissflogii]
MNQQTKMNATRPKRFTPSISPLPEKPMYHGSRVKPEHRHDHQNGVVSVSPATQIITHQRQVSSECRPDFEHAPFYTPESEAPMCGSNQSVEEGRFMEVTPTAILVPEKSTEKVCSFRVDHGIEHNTLKASSFAKTSLFSSNQDNDEAIPHDKVAAAKATSASPYFDKPSGLDLLLLAVSASPDANSDQDGRGFAGSQDSISTNQDADEQLKAVSIATSRLRRTRTNQTQKEPKLLTTKRNKNATTAKRSKGAKNASKSDNQNSSSGAIETPGDLDILRGRGGTTNRHKGNMRFRDEARKLRSAYRDDGVSRKEKYMYSNASIGITSICLLTDKRFSVSNLSS